MQKWLYRAPRTGLIAVFLTLVFILQAARASDQDRSTLDIVYNLHPYGDSLDANKTSALTHYLVLNVIFEPLAVNARGITSLSAATSIAYQDEGQKIRVELRDDLKWSDGTPITAADYVRGILRTLTPDSENRLDLEVVSGVEADGTNDLDAVGVKAVGDYAFEISLKIPYGLALESFNNTMQFFPVAEVDDIDSKWAQASARLSNGPYMIDQVQNEVISVVPNPYWRNKDDIHFDRINFTYAGSVAKASEALLNGEADAIAHAVSAQTNWALQNAPNKTVYYHEPNWVTRAALHPDSPARDPEIYKALNMALDRSVLEQNSEDEASNARIALVLPSDDSPSGFYQAPKEYHFDPESYEGNLLAARAIMEAKGYSAEKPLQLSILRNTPDTFQRNAIVSVLKANWGFIHVELVDIEQEANWDEALEIFQAGGSDMILEGFAPDLKDFLSFAKLPYALQDLEELDPVVAEKLNAARASLQTDRKQEALAELDLALFNSRQTIHFGLALSKSLIADYLKVETGTHYERLALGLEPKIQAE